MKTHQFKKFLSAIITNSGHPETTTLIHETGTAIIRKNGKPNLLFQNPLTAEQLQHLRELRAEPPAQSSDLTVQSSKLTTLPESLLDAFIADPLFVGLLLFANGVAFLTLLHFIL